MPTAPRLRADVFPAVVALAPPDSPLPASSLPRPPDSPPTPPEHRRLEKVRIVVTLEQVLIFQDSSSGPQLVFSEPLLDYTPPAPQRRTLRNMYSQREALITTESGKTIAFHRSAACGCGSRLKGFRPFGPNTTYAASSNRDTLSTPAS